MHTVERRKGQAGFSLPEMMLTMAILLIVVGAVLSQVKSAFQTSNAAYEMTEAQEGLRFAQEYINRDLVTTGDGLRGINNIRLPLAFVRTYIKSNPVTNPNDPNYVTLSVVTSDNNVAAGTAVPLSNPSVNVMAGTDRITFLMIDQNFTPMSLPANGINASGSNVSLTSQQLTDGGFQIGEIYFITSQYGATFGAITNVTGANGNNPNLIFANSDPYGLNQPSAANGNISYVSRGPNNQPVPTSLMRMQMIQYFVNANGVLVRRVYGVGGAGYLDSTVAENVADLQYRYFLNDTAQPVTQLSNAQQESAVRQVETTVSVRTAHPMANGQRPVVSATTSTSVRNLQFREAL
jgi:prepilin-type N-terminal cleavage/methylation domain-containing protein